MVILAHPDDESFPMGGTLAKYAARGVKDVLVCATLGEAGIPDVTPKMAARIRSAELRCAAGKLGIREIRFLGFRDGTLSDVDVEELTVKLISLMQEYRPQAVITFGPDGISGHPDHVTLSARVTQAFDHAALPDARLYYLAPSEATLQGCGVTPSQEVAGGPVASIDITDYRLPKLLAMQAHASQNPPFKGTPEEEIENLACHEYFVLVRPPDPMSEMTDLLPAPGTKRFM
jgi:LmbE family N-acetylglucosaminyl deacetylase